MPEQDPECLARARWLECSHRSIQRERTPNEHGYQEGNQCGGNSQRPALGGSAGAQSEGGRQVRLFGQEHRRVLPALVCRAHRQARERRLPRHAGRRRARGLSSLQALQARSALARRPARGQGRGAVPVHRERRGTADARRARAARGIERVSPASRVQGCHRPDAEGLCPCASREAGAQGAWQQRNGDAGDLRRWLQLAGPVLRGIESIARHDAHALSCRRRRHRDPLRGGRMLARVDPRRAKRARRVRDHDG